MKRELEQIRDLDDRVDRAAVALGCGEAVRQAPLAAKLAALEALTKASEELAREHGLRKLYTAFNEASERIRSGSWAVEQAIAHVRNAAR